MSVERASALINETIILRCKFQYGGTNDYFDPYEISKVEILDDDGVTVLETLTGADIVKDSLGNYHVVASALVAAQTIYDKWYFKPNVNATTITKTNTCIVWETISGVSGNLTVGTNTWVTAQEAEDYFGSRLGASTYWNDNTEKVAALVTAYKYLNNSGLYSIDADEDAQAVKDAQCEMALFLLQHMADMDARQGIQAQGVSQAGIVQETYDLSRAGGIVIPPIVERLLGGYESGSPIKAVDLTRDEDEDVV